MSRTDRRNARRFNMKLPLNVRLQSGAGAPGAEHSTHSEDVSSRGVYFYLPKEMKSGANIEIVMTLPHEVTLAGPVRVRCMGHVARTEQRGDSKVGIVAAIERYEFLRGDVETVA